MKKNLLIFLLVIAMLVAGVPMEVIASVEAADTVTEDISTTTKGEAATDQELAYLEEEAAAYEAASKAGKPFQDNKVLLIQDNAPWKSNANHTVLSTLAPYDTVSTEQFFKTDLSNYAMIVFANDQKFSTYNRYSQLKEYLEAFVKVGGVLVFGACDAGWAGGELLEELPGGVSKAKDTDRNNTIRSGSHPIVTGRYTDGSKLTNSDLVSNYCSHIFFVQNSLPSGTTVILQNESKQPTLIEYKIGKGTVLASGLTWEHNYVYGGQSGRGAFARKSMDDLFAYGLSKCTTAPKEFKSLNFYRSYANQPSVLVVAKETQDIIDNASVKINDAVYYTDSLGICYPPIADGTYTIEVNADGYRTNKKMTTLSAGQMEVFYMDADNPKGVPYVTMFSGNSDEGQTDLLHNQIYVKEKDKTSIQLSVSGNWNGRSPGKYILFQGSKQLTFTADSLTVIPGEKFTAESPIYLMMIAGDGTKSEIYRTGICVKERSSGYIFNSESAKQEFSFGQEQGFTIDPKLPILGGTSFKMAFNRIPAKIVIKENKARIAFGITDYKNKEDWWEDFTKKIDKACETADRLETLKEVNKAYGAKSGAFTLKSGWGSDLIVSGYAEAVINDQGQLSEITGKICLGAEAKYSYNQQFIVGPVPVYFEIGGGAKIDLDASIKKILLETGHIEIDVPITFTPFATIGGGVGINGALSVGAEGKVTLPVTLNTTQKRIKIKLEGNMKLKASLLFVFTAEKEIAKGTWVILDKYYQNTQKSNNLVLELEPGVAQALMISDSGDYNLENRNYLNYASPWYGESLQRSIGLTYEQILKEYVMPGSVPQMETVNGTKVLIFQSDNGSKDSTNYVRLMYSVQNYAGWSVPQCVWENGRGDYHAAIKNINGELYVVWQKARDNLAQVSEEAQEMLAQTTPSVPSVTPVSQQEPQVTQALSPTPVPETPAELITEFGDDNVTEIPTEDEISLDGIEVFSQDGDTEAGVSSQTIEIDLDNDPATDVDVDPLDEEAEQIPQVNAVQEITDFSEEENEAIGAEEVHPFENEPDESQEDDASEAVLITKEESVFSSEEVDESGHEAAANPNPKDMDSLAAQMEIAYAKWSPELGKFVNQQYLTNNAFYDGSPSIASTAEGLTAVWVSNEKNDILGNKDSLSLLQKRVLKGDKWDAVETQASVKQHILTLDAGSVDGNLVLTYTADTDGNINTSNDVEAYFLSNHKITQLAKNNLSDLNAQILGDTIYWYYNGSFYQYCISTGKRTKMFSESKVPAGANFKITADNGQPVLLWFLPTENNAAEFYGSQLTAQGWSIPLSLGTINANVKFFDGTMEYDGSWNLVTGSTPLNEPEKYQLVYHKITPQGDLALEEVSAYDNERSNGLQPVNFIIKNHGLKPITGFNLACFSNNTLVEQRYVQSTVQPGGTLNLTGSFQIGIPEEVKDYRFVISSDEDSVWDNNEQTVKLGYTDLSVNVKECHLDRQISLFITANNLTDRAAPAAITVRETNDKGKVLAKQTIDSLLPGESFTFNYVIDKSTINVNAGKDKKYFVSVDTQQEGAPSDNHVNVLIHSLKNDIISIQLNNKETDLVLDYNKYSKNGYSLKKEVIPASSTSRLTWTSSNTKVAAVKGGKLTLKGPGNTKITATGPDKTTSAYVNVHVIKHAKTAPTQVKISNRKTDNFTITWKKVAGAKNYEVLRSASKNGKYTSIGRVSKNSFQDHMAEHGKTYYYRVRTYGNYYGSFMYGNMSGIVSAKALLPSPSVRVSGSSPTKMYLNWNSITGAEEYEIMRAFSKNGKYVKIGTTKNSYWYDESIVPNKQYYYRVYPVSKKIKGFGNSPVAGKYELSTIGYFYAEPHSYNSIRLYIGSQYYAAGYQIYYSAKEKGKYSLLKNTGSGEFIHQKLSFNKTYYYKARYYVIVGNKKIYSPFTAPKSATTALAVPRNFTVKSGSKSAVISWDKVDGASGYEIYRDTYYYGSYKRIASAKTNSYENKKLKSGQYYYYKIRAYRIVKGKKYYSAYTYPSSCRPL